VISNNKIYLRTKYLSERRSMEKKEINSLSYSVTNKLKKMKIWDKTYYHIYNSILENNELNTYFLINFLSAKQKQIIIPKIQNNRLLHFKIDDSTDFKLNNYGINEPINGTQINIEKIDIIFIPLIIFDLSGHRVGYGKGYYDRFLKSLNSNTVKIGLSLFEPVEEIIDINNYDVSMDICVTPNSIYDFK
jgi:5-formyltetrahydrofolate cyclo-ligase